MLVFASLAASTPLSDDSLAEQKSATFIFLYSLPSTFLYWSVLYPLQVVLKPFCETIFL